MNKYFLTTALTLALWGGLSSCTTILEPQKLDNQELTAGQEVFEINYAPLTFEVARTALRVAFSRELKISGIGAKAGLVSEEAAVGLSPPPATANPRTYRLGSGDEVTFSQLNVAPTLFLDLAGQAAASRTQPNAVSSQTGRIGSDGSVLFIGVGRIELAGKTLSEVRGLVTNALIRTGGTPNFQLEISSYNSKFVLLSADKNTALEASLRVPISETPLSLRELLVLSGLSRSNSELQLVRLIRGAREYRLTVDHIFAAASPNYYLADKDHVIVETLAYKPSSVFLVGAVATPALVSISAEGRETLADVLFTAGGPLETGTTRKSEIYLLRGRTPTVAWHLDAQNPARLLVAAEMELRPNDIIFVTEKPIISFGKTLGALLPIETLLSKISIQP
jgi:polysaccharide export outer membrane protein